MNIPRLHRDTTEEVKQRADIVDVVSEAVVLKKQGKDFSGLCPFHEEKTPSFTVSPAKQLYYCFGCGAGGNVLNFLMELRKQSFSEVVLDLARRYQIPVKTLEPEQHQEFQRQLSLKEQLYEILAVTNRFYQHALSQPQGETALRYLHKERKLDPGTIQQFQLGYAPAGWDTLYRYLVEQKRYALELVKQAGLIKERKTGNGYYDRFRDRVTIPICDHQGRIIAFGTRTLSGDEPKYLNSPETPLFDKGRTLFALDKAKNGISKEDKAVVVEGYFDAIALHTAGISNAIASLGTAFSENQLKQILRYTESKQVILNFDADKAGTKATQRAISEIEHLVYTGQVQLRVLNLIGGKDADEYLQSSPDAIEKYKQQLLEAPLWLDWQINQVFSGNNLKDAVQLQQIAKNLVQLLSKLESQDLRTHYVNVCAEKLSQGDSRLIPIYAQSFLSQLKQQRRPTPLRSELNLDLPVNAERNLLEQAESLLLRIYLHCPEYRQGIFDAFEEKDLIFSLSHYRFFWRQILQLEERVPSDQLLSRLQDLSFDYPEEMGKLMHLFHLDEKTIYDIRREPLVIRAAIASLERVTLEKHKHFYSQALQNTDHNLEPKRCADYALELMQIQKRLQALDKLRHASLNDVVHTSSV
jgi:DNA primase